jgi:hypothetical protein
VDCHAYLVGNDKPDPAEPYNMQTQVLACGRYMVPAFWLSGFSSRHITENRMSDFLGKDRVPWAVAETAVVKRLVAERYDLLAKTFSQFGPNLEEWKKLVDDVKFKYIKIDMTQIWSFDRKTYTSQFPAAIRWFESQEAAYFDQLLAIADMKYDPKRQTFKFGSNDRVAAHHLRGYRGERPVPWPDVSWFRKIWGP